MVCTHSLPLSTCRSWADTLKRGLTSCRLHTYLHPEGAAALASFPGLRELQLVDVCNTFALTALTQLTELTLDPTVPMPADLCPLAALPQLAKLSLRFIQQHSLEPLHSLTQIRHLHLHGCSFKGDAATLEPSTVSRPAHSRQPGSLQRVDLTAPQDGTVLHRILRPSTCPQARVCSTTVAVCDTSLRLHVVQLKALFLEGVTFDIASLLRPLPGLACLAVCGSTLQAEPSSSRKRGRAQHALSSLMLDDCRLQGKHVLPLLQCLSNLRCA